MTIVNRVFMFLRNQKTPQLARDIAVALGLDIRQVSAALMRLSTKDTIIMKQELAGYTYKIKNPDNFKAKETELLEFLGEPRTALEVANHFNILKDTAYERLQRLVRIKSVRVYPRNPTLYLDAKKSLPGVHDHEKDDQVLALLRKEPLSCQKIAKTLDWPVNATYHRLVRLSKAGKIVPSTTGFYRLAGKSTI